MIFVNLSTVITNKFMFGFILHESNEFIFRLPNTAKGQVILIPNSLKQQYTNIILAGNEVPNFPPLSFFLRR